VIRYGVLGALAVMDGEREIVVSAGRDRVVLAMLLLRAGRIVGVDELIDAVWPADPPATARAQLQTCVSRLRRLLPANTIMTDPGGYGISVGADDLDAAVFARLVASGRATADRSLLRKALDLWQGPALVGIDSPEVRRAAEVLDEQRVVATADWVDLELADGRHHELVGELAILVERFPLRERLRGQLMLALARSGRPAEALAEFRRGREVLNAELGIEPGAGLQDLHRRILAGESALPGARIRCLPRTVADFTGRDETVRRIVKTIEQGDPAAPMVAMIDGMAGSGKTTLALHVAGLVGDRYPDAHLFIDLDGHSERAPVEPAAALLALLRQLGVAPERIPADAPGRVNLWRGELDTCRVLMIFDNAASSAQLVDLLPTSPGSLALVTSRRRLAGLDAVHPESLPVLTDDEAIVLLERIAGSRVAAEPAAAAEVVRRCGALPLAIRLAGSRLAHRPRWRVADLVHRLGTAALPELAAEDRTVASAFALSYGQLPDRTRRLFRLLGLYPGPVFDALGAAALTGLPAHEAQDVLDDLVDVHLIEEPEPGVFRLHDLLREYAAALAADLPPADRAVAVVAVLDFQVHAIAASVPEAKRPTMQHDLRLEAPLRPDLAVADDDAEARVERERPNLAGFMEAAVAAGRPEFAWRLARVAWQHLWVRGYTGDIIRVQGRAMDLAAAAGDRPAEAMSANYLGAAYFRQARYPETERLVKRCLRIREELGDEAGTANALGNLVGIYGSSGRYVEAVETATAALRLYRRGGNVYQAAEHLNNLAVSLGWLGRYDEALRLQRLRLMMLSEQGNVLGVGNSLIHLCSIKLRAGVLRTDLGFRMIVAALRLFERASYRFGEAEARNELGRLLRSEGRYAEALVQQRLAMELVLAIGDRRFEAQFINEMAVTIHATGDSAAALELHQKAVRVAREVQDPYGQANAHLGLGDCLAASDPAAAGRHWQQALDMFERMGSPERHLAAKRLNGGADHLQAAAGGGTMEA
jgi:DNA-binding SARP family transcriptional activator/tetratricopeptide (TPR) repeat protein